MLGHFKFKSENIIINATTNTKCKPVFSLVFASKCKRESIFKSANANYNAK